MTNRAGISNIERFPYRLTPLGYNYCRWCGTEITEHKLKTFCSPRCLRDFFMQTDWKRVREVVYVRDGGICMKCGKPVDKKNFHVDHIQPLSKGGEEWNLNNLELSCPFCNLSKGSR